MSGQVALWVQMGTALESVPLAPRNPACLPFTLDACPAACARVDLLFTSREFCRMGRSLPQLT